MTAPARFIAFALLGFAAPGAALSVPIVDAAASPKLPSWTAVADGERFGQTRAAAARNSLRPPTCGNFARASILGRV